MIRDAQVAKEESDMKQKQNRCASEEFLVRPTERKNSPARDEMVSNRRKYREPIA